MELKMGENFGLEVERQEGKNKRLTLFIESKIREFIKFQREGLYMGKFNETDFGYKNSEQEIIKKKFERLAEMVSDIGNDAAVSFSTENPHLEQIITNSPSIEQLLAERMTKKKAEKISPETDLKKMKNLVIMNTELTEKDIDWLLNFKKNLNLLLYYFDLMEDEEHRDVFVLEITRSQGWLESFEKYYKKASKEVKEEISGAKRQPLKDVVVAYIKFPEDSISRLQNMNFFARLEGWESGLGNGISETAALCQPIKTEEEFEEAFEKLKNKDDLDKEKIKNGFLKKPYEFKKAA